MPLQFSWTNNQKKDDEEKKVNPFVNKYAAVQQARGTNGGDTSNRTFAAARPTNQPIQEFNYQLKSQDQWNAPDYAAYGRLTGNNQVFEDLNTMTDSRGSQFWNPYRGGRSITPKGCEDFFRDNFGYEGPFDQQFCNDFNALYGNDVRFSNVLGVSTPTKKSTPEEWAGWYVTQIQDSLLDNNTANQQWGEVRKAYNDYYDEYTKVNGRAPSYEEFEASVDRSKYSKLKAIDESLQYGTKLQLMPAGTYYSPDIIQGLYQAKQNGEDINVDRDYFDDAVQYAMNPVQKSQSVQKYIWSNDNLNETSEDERDKYLKQLYSTGEYEEAEAYLYSWWAAQPHDDGISAEPAVLDEAYGYYHDEAWFNRVEEALGDEYQKRLKFDGTMDNPGKNGSYMDQVCWEFYNAQKTRDKTGEIQKGYEDVISTIQKFADNNLGDYTADQYEDFQKDILRDLDLEHNDTLKTYLKDGYDPSKYCRDLHFSNDTINAAIKHAWNGERLSASVDYAAQADEEYEPSYAQAKAEEPPLFYDYKQQKAGEQRMLDRNNAEETVTDAVVQLAESGAVISKGAIPPMNSTFDRILTLGVDAADAAIGVVGKLWKDVFGSKHSEKLGADFTDAEAASVDPVLAQLDARVMPEKLTTDDIAKIVNAKVMSRVSNDDICLADGVINYALPGAEHLHRIMLDRSPIETAKEFNALTYRNVYNDRVNAGMPESVAAKVAAYAATDVNQAVKSIGTKYEGDKLLVDAGQKLLNDMAQEEGSKDSYDIYMAISDDVRQAVGDPAGTQADDIMQKLLPGLMLGSSEAATPGFRAETNRMTHDIATGTITADDVVEGLSDIKLDATGVDRREYEGATVSKAAETFLRNGGSMKDCFKIGDTIYTKVEYNEARKEANTLTKKASGFFGSDRAFDEMSPMLKDMIGYDGIVESMKAIHGEDEAQYYIDDAIHSAVEDISNPDATWHTSPLMHNATDFIDQLDKIGNNKSEDQISANLENTRQSWMEQNVLKKDLTGFSSAVAAFFGAEQSATGDMIDLFRRDGKFLSRNELDAAWNAFTSGRASYDEIAALVQERVQATSSETVNALNNPDVLEESYGKLDEGLARMQNEIGGSDTATDLARRLINGESMEILNEYPGIFDVISGEEINNQLDFKDSFSEAEMITRITDELSKYDFGEERGHKFTPDQMVNIGQFVNLYKYYGAMGFDFAQLDAKSLKKMGINLEGTGFNDGSELLSYVDKDWSAAYGKNPGYTFGNFEAVAKGMGEGYRAVLKVPTLVNRFFHDVGYNIIGQEYDPNSSSIYRAFKQQDEQTAAMQQNVATKGQAFVEQGVSEVVRNSVSSAIGGMLGEAVGTNMAANMTGMPMAIDNISAAGEALEKITKLVSRGPFATSVFMNEYDQQRKDGASVLKAAVRGVIDAGIELATEDMPFEKLYSFRIGGFSVGQHAVNGATSMGSAALKWVGNSAKNMLTEISEEEASEFLGRLVDTGEAVINGEGLGDALRTSFEGYGQAAKDTALATAFTTLIFSAADLGGVTHDYMSRCIAEGRQPNTERLMTAVQADILANKDEQQAKPTSDYDPTTQVPFFGKRGQESSGITVEENTAKQEGETTASKVEAAKNALTEAVKADVKAAMKRSIFNGVNEDGVDVSAVKVSELSTEEQNDISKAWNEQEDKADVAAEGEAHAEELKKLQQEEDEAIEAAKTKPRTTDEIVDDLMKRLAEQRAELQQEQMKRMYADIDMLDDDSTEDTGELTLELSDNAQRVRDYVDHADTAIDNAIIDKGAEMEAEKTVAADPGLRAREESIQKMQGQLQETEQKIAGMQQQAQTITNKMAQMYRAAMDAGLDARSPQAVNAQFQLSQSQQAVQADIGKESEKQNTITRQIEEANQQLEAERERIMKEAKETATKEFAKKIEAAKEKLAQPGAAKQMLDEMDAEAERDLNSIRARQGGYNVNSQFTNAEDQANRAAVSEEQSNKSTEYSEELSKSSGMEATERYTDPENYQQKSVVTERRDSEWQDEAKHRQDRLNENVQDEQRNRARNAFAAWRQENAPVNYVSVSPQIYALIQKKIAEDTSTDLMDDRYLKRPQTGDAAPVAAQIKNGRKIERDQKGYSENAEDTGVYSAGDFLNDDGTVTGLAYRAIVAADPSFANNPGVLKTNATQGGVDAVLNHVTENNRYLVLSTPQQTQKFGEGSLDADRYTMLTKEKGLRAYEREATRTQKVVDQYLERMRNANDALEQQKAAMNDPTADQVQAANDYQKTSTELDRAQRGYRAAQSEMEKAKQKLVEAQEFIRNYEASGNTQRKGRTMYVIDKAAIEDAKTPSEVYQEAFNRAADRVAENAFLSDEGIISLLKADAAEGNTDAEEYIDRRFGSMSHEELGAALFDHFLQQELQKGNADQYKGAVQVIDEKQLGDFVKANGGYSADGFGGEGFGKFIMPNYFFKNQAWMASEEAILKFVPESMYKGLVREANGNTADFNATKAKYNSELLSTVRRYAAENGLSDADATFLADTYGIRSEAPRKVGKNTIVTSDDTHFFGVPTKDVEDYEANTYLRADDGSYDVARAKRCLENELRYIVQLFEDQEAGQTNKRFNSQYDYIGVDYVDDHGYLHKNMKVGEFYSFWKNGSRFLPSYDELMEMSDKIVCNFFVRKGKNNQDSKVNFVLVTNKDRTIDLQRDMESVDRDQAQSDLAYRRGHQEVVAEREQAEDFLKSVTNDPDLKRNANLVFLHSKFNTAKNELRTALTRLQSCTPELYDYYMGNAAVLSAKVEQYGEEIRNAEESAYNTAKSRSNDDNSAPEYGTATPSEEMKAARSELEKEQSKPQSAKRDARISELEAKIRELRPKMVADNVARLQQQEKDRIRDSRSDLLGTARSAQESYNKAKERYDALTDQNGPYADESWYDAERKMLAEIIPTLKERADQEEQQPQPKHPDPTTRQIAETLMSEQTEGENAVAPEAKLAVLKGLSDDGADIADIRSKAIQEYHDKAMEGMSEDEKIDYVAALARQQAETKDGYTIDPNVDYDAMLGDMMKKQVKKQKSQEARRLRDITRKAGMYKTTKGINSALGELDTLEQAGYDVKAAREALQKRLESFNNPYKAQKQELVDAADTPDMKMDLQFFSDETQEEAVDSIMDTMPDAITEHDAAADAMLEAMSESNEPPKPPEIDTGFNKMVDDVRSANVRVATADQAKASTEELAELAAKVENLNDMINEKATKVRTLEGDIENTRAETNRILQDTGTRFTDSDSSARFDTLAKKVSAILKQTAEVEANVKENGSSQQTTDLLEGLANDLQETRSLMQALEQSAGGTWTDEQRDQYGQLLNRVGILSEELARKKEEKTSLVDERNAAKESRDSLSNALIRSSEVQRITHNEATFNMQEYEGSEGETANQIRSRRLSNAVNAAKKLLGNIRKSRFYVHGKATSLTAENMADMMRDGVIDEKRLNEDRSIAMASNQALKAQKKALILLEYGVQYGDFKTGKITEVAFKEAAQKARTGIFELAKLTGYGTDADRERETRERRKAYDAVEEYRRYLDQNVFSGSISKGMDALTYQQRVLGNQIDKAEQNIHDRFGLSSTGDVLKALDGSNGGRLPQAVLDVLVGSVYDSQFRDGKAKKVNWHPISRNLRSFRAFVNNSLGQYAPIFNSIIVDPVLQGEAKATAWKKQMTDMLDSAGLKTKAQFEAMGHILDGNMTENEIRNAYGNDADVLIKAKPIYQRVLQMAIQDQNVVLSRNGHDLIKWRDSYYPHQMREQNAFFRAMGIDSEADKLPTGLLGRTEGTTPSQQFAAHTLERSEDNTETINWNARDVLDKYLNNAASIIYQTDNLVRVNDLITQLGGNRQRTGNKNVDYAAVSPLEYSTVGELAKRGRSSLFVNALETWRDQVAGKKTGVLDRAVERQGTRAAISTIQTLTKMQGVAKVGGNLKTCMLNAVPMLTSAAMHPFRSVQAGFSMIANALSGNNLFNHPELQRSAFFKARCEDGRKATCTFDKATGWLFVPMEFTDRVSTAYTWLGNYYSTLDKIGGVGNEKQAAQMADTMTSSMMSSKLRGDKGEAYNSTVGGLVLQFTQEAANQIGFLAKDMAQYHGGSAKGVAKALASMLAVFVAGFYGNKLVGSDSTIDPISVGLGARDDIANGKKASEAIGSAITRFIDQLNPVENITSGNIFEAPTISGVTDIFSAFSGGFDAALSALVDNESGDEESNDSQWVGDLAKALWGWVPGSTQAKRVFDTVQAAQQGYATSTSGKVKFAFEPTAGNMAQSMAFGLNATPAGQEYVRNGYKSVNKTRTEAALSNADALGIPFAQALDIYDREQAAKAKQTEANTLSRWGEDNTTQAEEAKALRSEVAVPNDMSQTAKDNIDDAAIQKGIKMYQESGLVTYPTEYTVHNDPERGLYFQDNGRNIAVDQETVDKMNADFFRNARRIIRENDDAETVAKMLTKLKNSIKKEYLGGE